MTSSPLTYDLSLLEKSQAKWKYSSGLRVVYGDIFVRMRRYLIPGSTLEVGSGIGMAKDYFQTLTTSDVVATSYVDRPISAYDIPCENWSNVIALDTLHHLREPLRFLKSAAAALAPGGRIVLAEPAGTAWGRFFYGWFHHEPCEPDDIKPPFVFDAFSDGSFANMGMARALFARSRVEVASELQKHQLTIRCVHYRDLIAYPATGGFSRTAVLPVAVLRWLLTLEQMIPQFILQFIALRMIVVLEKAAVQ